MSGFRIGQLDDPADGAEPPKSERPTNPPPPSYAMLRDSTVPPADDAVSLDDDARMEGAIDHGAASLGARIPERVLSDAETEWLALGSEPLALLAAIDGTRTVAGVSAHLGLDGDRTRSLLTDLVRRGVVRLL